MRRRGCGMQAVVASRKHKHECLSVAQKEMLYVRKRSTRLMCMSIGMESTRCLKRCPLSYKIKCCPEYESSVHLPPQANLALWRVRRYDCAERLKNVSCSVAIVFFKSNSSSQNSRAIDIIARSSSPPVSI